jgi:2-phospho-L-lactate guanylyltransferase
MIVPVRRQADATVEPPRRLRIAATLPIRSLRDGKRRLQHALRPAQRERLIVALCSSVVEALRGSGVVDMIALVSGDEAALAFGERLGLAPILEERSGLNEALRTAALGASASGADGHLIVLPDLPLLRPADVRAVVEAAPTTSGIVACPDHLGTGTNLLLQVPCQAMPTAFGVDSFHNHLEAARQAGLSVTTIDAPGTRWDVDTPDDLTQLSWDL